MSVVVEDVAVETPVNGGAEVITDPVVEAETVLEATGEAPAEVVESPEAEKVDAPDEAKPDEVKPDEPVETVTFDTAAALPELKENITKVLDGYELPQPVQAVIDALTARVDAVPVDGFAEFAEYAPEDAAPEVVTSTVKTLLDRQALLDSVTETQPGQYRPNTDKFAQELNTVSPDKADWLNHDLNSLPSNKYRGINKFEENIVDACFIEGDTVQSVLTRYYQTISAVKNGAQVVGDVPAFVPAQLRDAYWSLAKEEREEIDLLDPDLDRFEEDNYGRKINQDEQGRNRKLTLLAQIQDGIDSKKQIAQTNAETLALRNQEFHQEVQSTQVKFYDAFREYVTAEVAKNIKFSDNPKMQTILAHQNVSFLGQALDDGSAGESARQVLKDAGINFDVVRAQQLQKDIEAASVALAQAKRRDAQGNILNPTDFNKATAQFKKKTGEWQVFAKTILDQQAPLVSTGTAEAVKAAAEKIKVAPKARAGAKGVGAQSTNKPQPNPYRYGTPEYYGYQADEIIRAQEAQKARAYA